MNFFLKVLLYFIAGFLYTQENTSIEKYKEKFFLYPTIGTDSALVYVEKVFTSNEPLDIAFAYTAKRHLLTVTSQDYNEEVYLENINTLLAKTLQNKKTYKDLSNVYNILGNTFLIQSNIEESFKNFMKADKYAILNNDIKQQIKIKGNLALIKNINKDYLEALKDFKKVDELYSKNKNLFKNDYYNILEFNNKINLSREYHTIFEAVNNSKYLDSANYILKQIDSTSLSKNLKADLDYFYGVIYREEKDKSLSNKYFLKSLNFRINENDLEEAKFIYFSLGYNSYNEKKYSKAKEYFKKVVAPIYKDIVDFEYLYAHQYINKIYTLENKPDSAFMFLDKFDELKNTQTQDEQNQLKETYSTLENKKFIDTIDNLKIKNKKLNFNSKVFILLGVIVFFILIALYYFRHKNHQNNVKKLNDTIEKLKKAESEKTKPIESKNLKDETEILILKGLEQLEKEKYFLKEEFNLYNVAKKINTNTSYLSKTIKSHKNMGFKEYSNELKINYLLEKLVTETKLQNYTTQALAELLGYKNGNSFAKIFKQKVGATPFQFIEKINQ